MIVKNLRKLNTQQIISLVVVTASTFALLLTLHPDLILSNNTPTGGDMGAHVYGPAFLRDFLLPHFRLAGRQLQQRRMRKKSKLLLKVLLPQELMSVIELRSWQRLVTSGQF